MKVPDNIKDEQAVVLPRGVSTASVGLFCKWPPGLGLEVPKADAGRERENGQTLLVWGGSGSVGVNAI